MATILRCVRSRPPTGFESGSAPNSYSAEWRVAVDDKVPFTTMLFLARRIAATGENQPLPHKGSTYRWTTFDNVKDFDRTAIALDFDCTELLDDGKSWVVNVRWRQPVPGQGEEPKRVKKTRDHTRKPNADAREPYRWIEYFTELRDVTEAQNLRSFGTGDFKRKALTKGPITTAAGEETEKAQNETMHSVFVTERIVKDQLTAHRLNEDFSGSINSDSFRHPLLGQVGEKKTTGNIGGKTARYLRAETSQYPFWESGREWYTMQIRIQIQPSPFQFDLVNRGVLFYDATSNSIITNTDTDGRVTPANLSIGGGLLFDPAASPEVKAITIPYITHRIKSFTGLTRFL